MNRPERANALDTLMANELERLFRTLGQSATSEGPRCVVLTGAGERAFCAGADLKERRGMDDAAWTAQHRAFEAALAALLDCPLPCVAAVNGAAFGGGLELALACDFAYGSSAARFALTETTLGIISGLGGTQNLPRAAGSRRAKELIFTGAPFGAPDALAWGVLNRVVAPNELLDAAHETAHAIAANAPLAVREAKRVVDAGAARPLREALEVELDGHYRTMASADRREGIAAFNEKRPPRFAGE